MKSTLKLNKFHFLLCLSCIESQAQIPSHSEISYKALSVSGVLLGAEKETLIEKFGRPDTIVKKTNEFEGTLYCEYVYGGSVFFISANKFEGFMIRDRVYHVFGAGIQIGESVENLKTRFPVSFKNRYQDENMTVVKVRIDDTGSYILFHYADNNKISEISTWDDLRPKHQYCPAR